MLLYVVFTLYLSTADAQTLLSRAEIAVTASASSDYLLPSNVVPVLYQLELEPNFETDTYTGSINITFTTISSGFNVTLHALELEIDDSNISLLDENGDMVNSVVETSYSNNNKQFYTIVFANALEEGSTYTLVINPFTSKLNDENRGFYLARYTNEDGIERKLAVTDFEPTLARRAFPCFDEPALKAEFDITVIRTSEYKSISNSPLISTEEISTGRYRDRFARTPRMSTYIVCVVVSDFAYVADQNQRVFGRPAAVAAGLANYSLGAGIRILDVLSEFVGVPYTLPKMDQIGLPEGYFDWGAMENWGLATYREDILLFTYEYGQYSAADIISHEFAHQWFGNLVTPSWWSHLWLSEGFATYLQNYGLSVEHNFDFEVQTLINTQLALWVDSYESTRPLNQDAGSPEDLITLFDTIAYYKGASVIRMVEGILSTEIFKNGLNIYLNKMAFGAAKPTDLYSSWQTALHRAVANPFPGGEDVESVMATWVSNTGYPLVTVTTNNTNRSVTFSQRRFIWTNPNNSDKSIWYVPISYATQSKPDFSDPAPQLWLTERDITLDLDDLSVDDWIIVNLRQTGYYRVNYDNENWYRIIDFLASEDADQIHSLNVRQLVDDAYELFNAGVIDSDIYFGISQNLLRKTNYAALESFISTLNRLDSHLVDTDIYGKFKAYVLEILETAFNSVGLVENKNDSSLTKLNRKNIVTWICAYGHEACKEYALQQLREWKRDGSNTISPYLQVPLICTALRMGDLADWEFVFQQYMAAKYPLLRQNLLKSLGCSENKDVINRYLAAILDSESNFTKSDRLIALSSIYTSSNYGRIYISSYLRRNWSLLNERFSSTQLSSIIKEIASKLSTQKQLAEMEHLAVQIDDQSVFKSGIETLKSNVIWVEKHVPSITAWLNKRY